MVLKSVNQDYKKVAKERKMCKNTSTQKKIISLFTTINQNVIPLYNKHKTILHETNLDLYMGAFGHSICELLFTTDARNHARHSEYRAG
jgi:hypothetical protein